MILFFYKAIVFFYMENIHFIMRVILFFNRDSIRSSYGDIILLQATFFCDTNGIILL